jgi:hypothetical protein
MIEIDENTLLEAVDRLTPQWLAGFFDGEGCVYAKIDPRNRTWMKVELTQKDPTILGLIALKFEVSESRSRVSPTKSGATTTGHTIMWSGNQAVEFLEYIKPHVIVKRRLVELALDFCELVTYTGGKLPSADKIERVKIVERIREINKRTRQLDPVVQSDEVGGIIQ